ncbi:MAG: FMN-binding negative transcriptional regulator [Chitinophagaceae bacterium]|nr:FMN-binding negative transcriptional regulator [Chitinophagaceae bacterium]
MYSLPDFKEKNPDVVKQFVREHPFAFLSGCNQASKPIATQVPVFIDEKDSKLFLTGHMMRNTDHHKAFLQNPNVLAVFTGAHSYVSASWYADKQQASTWNYMSVHAKGTIRFLDEAELLEVLRRTTNHFENNPTSGSNFDDIPTDYVERLIKAIVAFEITVEEIDNVFKLSQNRDEKSYDNIIRELRNGDGDAKRIAELMEQRKAEVFNS